MPGGGPVHTLFNTHWHPEQTGSNEQLGKAGATIIAQENTRLWLTQTSLALERPDVQELPKIAQPNKTFYTTGKLDSGVRYGYISDAAHTDGDLYVYFPKQNVLAVGDAVSGQGWPVVDWWTGGWIGGIVGGLQRLQTRRQRGHADRARARPGAQPGRPQGAGRHVRHDLRSSESDDEQGPRPDRSRGGQAGKGI